MMRIYVYIVALLCCATATAAQNDGYAGAKWGMTSAQVLAAVGTSKPGNGDELGGGRVLVVKEQIDVVGAQYTANFIFGRDDKLKSVMLRPVVDLDAMSGPNEFEKVDIALIGKYGQPYYTENGNLRAARWHAGSNDIELYLAVVPDIAAVVNIIYRPAASVTAGDNL